MTDRRTLESDLVRHQKSTNWAAQAKTLMALAELSLSENEYSLAQGLYGQAWAAYEHTGNKRMIGEAILGLSGCITNFFWQDEFADPNHSVNVTLLHAMVLTLYRELGDQEALAYLYSAMIDSHLYVADTTRDYLRTALALYEALDNSPKQAAMLMELIYWHDHDDPQIADWVTQAQSLYQVLDDKQGEIKLLHLTCSYNFASATLQQSIDRIHDLYHQLGDQQGEAKFYLYIGQTHLSNKNYEEARPALESAFRMSMQLEMYDEIPNILWHLCLLSAQADDYDTYRRTHEEAIRHLRNLNMHSRNLYQLLCDTARKHRDFAAARYGFQQAIGLEIALGWPEQQAEKYWLWGRMEYDEANHKQMGLRLCEWAVTLANRYFPGQNRYQRKFRIMQREMRPRPIRRSS
jgi:tetratricopeptide (TPR) repeat protein